MSIESAIYADLTTYASITAIAGARGYWATIPYNATLPAWAYQRVGTHRELMHNGVFPHVTAVLQFTCQATTLVSAKSLADAIRTRLHGYHGTMSGVTVHRVSVENDQDGEADEDGATVRLDATVYYTET